MKECRVKHHPELSSMRESEAAMAAMSRAIIEVWEAIPQEFIDNLIEGMIKWVETLQKAKDWHTKY